MKTNVVLIGFMGTGKTAVGRLLSEKLGLEFIELDRIIEKDAGKSIPDIFRSEGEIGFREYEIAAVKNAANMENRVIACGGGMVLNKINVDRMKQNGLIIRLTASPSSIFKRTRHQAGARPLLDVDDPVKEIRELIKYRKPYYERAADHYVNTTGRDIEEITREIMAILKNDESFNR